ncbi:somatostatin receptor type 5-like [Styela clava]
METVGELDAGKKAEIGVMLIVYLAGVVGDLLVIFVILYLSEYKKITHWYVLQLAVADLIFLQTIPFKISEITHKAWILPLWLCKAKQGVLYINYYGSIIFLTLMALDRYLAVCHGLSKLSHRIRSRRTCYVITAIVWIVAILMCIPVMVYADTIGDDPNCVCSYSYPGDTRIIDCEYFEEDMGHEALILFNSIVMFIIPLITISVCYMLIIVRLRRRHDSSSGEGRKQKTKVTIMCVVLVLLFATCWIPYYVVQIVKLKGIQNGTEAYCSGLNTMTIIFLYLNSALNPYLYNFLGTFGKRIR